MPIGPVQLIVLGFEDLDFDRDIIAELERLGGPDGVRVIDALALHKEADGEIEVVHLSSLSKDEAIELGSVVGALVGLEIEGEEWMFAGTDDVADGASTPVPVEAWDVLGEIPAGSSAALILIEHHWGVALRNAITRTGGFRIGDGFISPLDLIDIGLVSHEEGDALHAPATTGVADPVKYDPAGAMSGPRRVVRHAPRRVARRR